MKFRKPKKSEIAIAAVVVVVAGVAALPVKSVADTFLLKGRLQKAFPAASISSVDCRAGPGPLCEVIAGKNVFYSTRDAKYVAVGSVLDLAAKKDLTNARLRELAAMQEGEARILGEQRAETPAPTTAGPAAAPAAGAKVDLAELSALPKANAVVHNPGARLKMTVFTDLNCSFCQKLANDLKSVTDIEITEYPVAILSPDSLEKAKLALCSQDRVSAINAIHSGGELKVSGDCSAAEAAAKANTDFFHKARFQGTPVIVRADGTTNEGWMPIAELRTFLAGGR